MRIQPKKFVTKNKNLWGWAEALALGTLGQLRNAHRRQPALRRPPGDGG